MADSSSYAIGAGGIAEAVSKMAFGNGLGAVINAQLDKNLLFAPLYGNILQFRQNASQI